MSSPPPRLLIRGQWGLGDNIYARAFVKELVKTNELYLETPWPEIYADLNVKFVLGRKSLRTQNKNIARQPGGRWCNVPALYPSQIKTVNYGGRAFPHQNIPGALQLAFGVRADWSKWDLPDWGLPCPVAADRPIAVIRPVTVRHEWFNSARNPKPEYISAIAEQFMTTHRVVSVADCDASEPLVGPEPPCHDKFHGGELTVRELLTLLHHADIVVGGVGWIVPAAIALKIKAFVILGGHGAHNGPTVVTDPVMDLTRIGFAKPEKFCQCTNMRHNCEKTIPDLMEQFCRFLESQRCTILLPQVGCSGFQNSASAISP